MTENLGRHVSPSHIFFTFFWRELCRCFSDKRLWLITVFIILWDTIVLFPIQSTLSFATLRDVLFYNIAFSVIFATKPAAQDFRSHFSTTASMLFKNPLRYALAKLTILPVLSLIFSTILLGGMYGILFIIALSDKFAMGFLATSGFYTFGVALLLSILFSLCVGSGILIVKNQIGGFFLAVGLTFLVFPVIIAAGSLFSGLGLAFPYVLPYWLNILILIAWTALFVGTCLVINYFWPDRQPPAFLRNSRFRILR